MAWQSTLWWNNSIQYRIVPVLHNVCASAVLPVLASHLVISGPCIERAGSAETRATTLVSGCRDRDMDMDMDIQNGCCLHTCMLYIKCYSMLLHAGCSRRKHASAAFVEKASFCFFLVQTRIENIIETSLGFNRKQMKKSSGEGDGKRGVDLFGWTRMDGSSPLIPTFCHATREADSPSRWPPLHSTSDTICGKETVCSRNALCFYSHPY